MKTLRLKTPHTFFFVKEYREFFVSFVLLVLLVSMVQGCSGNGFHLRNNVELPSQYQSVYLEKLPLENNFKDEFEEALENAGGSLSKSSAEAKSIIRFENFKEGKRVVAYDSDLEAREYLLYLKLNYEVSIVDSKTKKVKMQPKRRINIDKSYLYDSDFALGKAEEEKLVKKNLYQEAARLILLRLQYSK